MKKENFISMLLGVFGGLLFALGMCMCLIPEWNAFNAGVAFIIVSLLALVVLIDQRVRKRGLPAIHISGHTLGAVALGASGTLIFGTGMCMALVWQMFIFGTLVGIVGIGLLLSLIPYCLGLK